MADFILSTILIVIAVVACVFLHCALCHNLKDEDKE